MLETNENSAERPGRCIILLSAIVILFIAWSVLIFGFPPGMETGAALLLITPFAMCIIVVEGSIRFAQYVTNRYEK